MADSETTQSGVTRREFVATAAATAAWMIVPRHVLGRGQTPPSDLVNIAIVGIHGMGAVNAQAVMSQNIVAICDVDDALVDAKLESWKQSLQPRPPQPPRPQQPPRPPAPPPPTLPWERFGPSKMQQAADAKWQNTPARAQLERFVNEQMPRVQKHRDYREMLAKQKDIDALIIATPDHMHAPIASTSPSSASTAWAPPTRRP